MKKTFLYFFTVFVFSLASCESIESSPTPTGDSGSTTEIVEKAEAIPLSTPTPAIDLSAELQEVEGNVEAKEEIDTDFSAAMNGTILAEKGEIRTSEDGYTRVDLSTGTLIRMAPLSHFTLLSNEEKEESLLTRIKLELGQLWVVLNGGSVEIETPSGLAAVRGSYMMVEIDPETQGAIISCLEGHCELENPAGIVQLSNGQRAILLPPELTNGVFILPLIEKMSERDFAEWLFFAPEAQDIFPFLEKEGLLPWGDWKKFVPDEDGPPLSFDELFPELDIHPLDGLCPPGEECHFLDGDGPLDGGGLLDGDGPLDGDGLLDGGGPLGGGGRPGR